MKRPLIFALVLISCGGIARVGERAMLSATTPYRVTPRKLGDFRGAVSSLDSSWASQAAVGSRIFTPEQTLACDVTGNGQVSSLDAALISRFAVGSITQFPIAALCGSDWIFIPQPAPNTGRAVAPVITRTSCSLGYIELDAISPPVEAQDFRAILLGDCTGSWMP